MRLPRVSSFSIIGTLLVLIGLYGLIKGPGFQFDSGVVAEHNEGFYYILVGVVMLINGFFFAPPLPEETAAKPDASKKTSAVKSVPVKRKLPTKIS
jgi:hypothetical protein